MQQADGMVCSCAEYGGHDDRCPTHGALAGTVAERGVGRRLKDTPIEDWEAWAARFFPSIGSFYAADPRRERSPEVDFGVMWRDGFAPWPFYRVSWIEATGEFYALTLSGRGGTVELLGAVPTREEADKVLDGWAYVEPQDIAWVRNRLRGST